MYVYMSECFYVFMYLYACKSDEKERGREVPVGQFYCLEECCYSSPRPINMISYKQILTLRVVKTHAFVF